MVYPKGKATTAAGGVRVLEDRRASKNVKDFKIYAGSERSTSLTGGIDRPGDSFRKIMGKAPPVIVARKSMPADVSAKPTGQIGRKPLADLSNVANAKSYKPRNRLSEIPKPLKGSLEGSTALQGKKNAVKSPCGVSKNKENIRVSLTKTVVASNVSLRKSIGRKPQGKENNTRAGDNSVRAGRKTLAILNKRNNESSCQLRNRLSNNPKPMVYKAEGHNLSQGASTKNPHRPRISLPRTVMIASASPSKVTETKSKIKRDSMIKHGSVKEKSAAINSSENKEEKAITSTCDANNPVTRQACGSENIQVDDSSCSNETVTAIIYRPKYRRRRSYTSSLMTRPKIIGGSEDLAKKDELPNIDDNTNPLEVAEYVDDIYQYYWTMEVLNPSLSNYMVIQSEVTPRMRGILINWLIEVHLKFELMQETLFLMVELLDRVLSIVPIKKKDLQMLGLTALLLASKYEDFWHPKIDELISISVNSVTREQMLTTERLVLTKLRYRLNIPTPYVFMLRFLKASQSDQKLEHLAFYLTELCLVEYEALRFKPSLLSASAIYVARCALHVIPAWTDLLRKHTRYEELQLRVCAEMILGFQRTAALKQTNFTYNKFLHPDRSSVAAIEALDKLSL